MDDVTRIRACLFGGAMGDALGAEIEFWSLNRIRARFPGGLTEMPPHDGRAGRITDDTQMTLFTAEGLIRAVVRGQARGICAPEGVVHHALLRWYRTQGGVPRIETCERGLVADARLRKRRAPGTTCLSALGEAQHFGEAARNDSKGCGTIMRVAPCALIARDAGEAETLARHTSALTHGHVLGQAAAVAFARILFEVIHGATLERAVGSVSLSRPIMAALEAAMTARPDGAPETTERLGGGWVAEEALAIAVYAARVGHDVEHGLQIAVTHGGDSDSTGAVAGNLLGLLHPAETLDHRWQGEIECADLIDRIASDLAVAREPGDDFAEKYRDRYPGF
ncbi:ADP-ribosyl-[dinitrogen reductase] glycohydrolase (plasmid) [Paracoccus marcusii]|uniref:ADP-ribosylglycohydrolase family protein n=1 Tax=Paracoccus marcusii TaxID=59779 RepID=UPI001FD0FC82|nr:ADP-ribosylglycohydrolase family protein [Paracoccus marcusii]QXI66090.1 ADP-ribosyl-[dinitrogen reductase] glycohydrolase [Paracoccus marcusii]